MKYSKYLFIAASACALLICVSCASLNNRIKQADAIAQKASLQKNAAAGKNFSLITFQRISDGKKPLHVYIEGDGKAYIKRTMVSSNPTPGNPLGLKLASSDPSPNILYIARPYQYYESAGSFEDQSKYWTTRRYSDEVVSDINEIISQVKGKNNLRDIILIGYSGGGALAALIATRRDDVILLVTVAGNLDTDFHTKLHNVSPLEGSLNPADFPDKLKKIKQVHFVGGRDTVVPPSVAESYREKISPTPENFSIIEIKGNTHSKGWDKNWRDTVNKYF
ncbi:MAG: alpha/beta hydrolase [Candidatus Aureabacteria bacterium]|nr:alpha/beta hydrolase [Candidatus Auribacterota bacterium]